MARGQCTQTLSLALEVVGPHLSTSDSYEGLWRSGGLRRGGPGRFVNVQLQWPPNGGAALGRTVVQLECTLWTPAQLTIKPSGPGTAEGVSVALPPVCPNGQLSGEGSVKPSAAMVEAPPSEKMSEDWSRTVSSSCDSRVPFVEMTGWLL
ncbi:hypothetical protein EOD39_4112 [Acipenser ruthenus]|uniref:Uncharacterized protein n=1 Tax=Acipenser ruthenus TaxID=7906 RepID=A0A444UJU6_ACIRT|nr:hypothetical protein EOD39_4112 [Acipenser ruthenus]